ncbi:MAG: S1 RNA-binding domain-containing protein [Myxococcales bacterium]|nr:S1 RNA-binding domain-containing protein [Myxococcales bacterium]MBL0195094.1 S1 RNA-binding domain-containing protein [Myxococcales bacterium]HQY61613.1 S1 RNA-binding domain-containing protein [Polyangiaceae bacterium]
MSTTENPTPPSAPAGDPSDASAAPSPASATASSEAPTVPFVAATPAASVEPDAHASDASDAEESDAEGEGGEAAEGEVQAGEAGQTPGEGGEKKKRRRRRRKKKPGAQAQEGGEGAPREPGEAGAEGAAADGGATGDAQEHAEGETRAEGDKPGRGPRPKKPKVEKERPAFNVGDVVFGKVLDVTEDVLFIDLSGKGTALFDLRELLITEEDAKADMAAADDEHEPRDAAPTTEASPGAPTADQATSDPEPAGDDAALAAETPADATASAAEAPADVTANSAEPPADATEPTEAAVEAAAAPAVAAEPAPQLPRVILEPGAPFVGVVHNDGGRGGLVVLTHHPKRVRRAKPVVAAAFRDKSLVFGIVTGVIKGGVEVDIDGLRGFAPGSHMDLRLGNDLHPLVGKRLAFAVTQYGKRGRDVVVSRRSMLEAESKERRDEALKNIKIGVDVDGVVRTVVSFGAFVDIGGVEGLVPLSEMSHNRADQPKDVFTVGETVRVRVLRVDEKQKVWLSRRATVSDPWSAVAEKYAPGTRHTGKVARLKPFGAFIELESGVDGLIQVGDLSVKRIAHPNEVLKEGDDIDVVVAYVEPGSHRIALHPAPTGEAAGETPQKIAPQRTVRVQIVSTDPAGLTVRVLGATGRHARGFITAGGTGTARGTDFRKAFPIGKELDAKIIEIDPKRGELKLSIKAMNEDTERNAYQQYRAQVKREAKFGTLADLLQKRNIVPNK